MPSAWDDDDRPQRRRSRRGRKRGSNVGMWVSLGGFALVLVVAGVVAVVLSRKGGPDAEGGTAGTPGPDDVARAFALGTASPPSGWKEYTYADADFKAYFPKEPTRSRGGIIGADVSGDPINYATFVSENGLNLYLVVSVARLEPHESPSVARAAVYKRVEEMSKKKEPGSRVLASPSITWMGYPARELRVGTPGDKKAPDAMAVTRFVVTDTHEFHATISSDDGNNLTSRLVNGFFDNIQPLK